MDCSYETETAATLSDLCAAAFAGTKALKNAIRGARDIKDPQTQAEYYHDRVLVEMDALRRAVDAMETMTDSDFWPCPSYGELLFGVR